MTINIAKLENDALAMSVARALAVANEAAHGEGVNVADSLVTISESSSPRGRLWEIHYGPRDYQNRRGDDVIIVVDASTGEIVKVLRGQ